MIDNKNKTNRLIIYMLYDGLSALYPLIQRQVEKSASVALAICKYKLKRCSKK